MVNRPLEELFDLDFDVGLTYRDVPGLMPVNEGVMLLSVRRQASVRQFLRRRLAAYDSTAADAIITAYYGDVKRWRGGQLSLNAVTYGMMPHSPYRIHECDGAAVRMLPCDTFNFSTGEGESAASLEHLQDRYIIHFKGARKYAFHYAAEAERTMSPAR
jgi:hypothetical protein